MRTKGRVAVVVWLMIALTTRGGPSIPFQWINPVPTGNDLYGVTYANGVFVAVGSDGTIGTSPNGFGWQLQSLANQKPLNLVAGGNGRFVAAGPGGLIVTSSDATNWAVQSPPTTNSFSAIGFGEAVFVLADVAGNIYASPTGTNWNVATSVADGNVVSSIAYGNGLFVGAAGAGTVTSPDGTNWTFLAAPNTVAQLSSIVFANGYFDTSGASTTYNFSLPNWTTVILQSTNGANWAVSTAGIDDIAATSSISPLNDVTFGNGLFSASYSWSLGIIFLVSTDSINWTAGGSDIPIAPYTVNAQAFGAGVFVGVGDFGTIETSTNLQAWSETNWFNQSLFGQPSYTPFGNTCFLASSSNVVVSVGTYYGDYGPSSVPYATGYVSTNGGLSWNNIPELNSTNNNDYQNLNGITWGNGTFVAVGGGYVFNGSPLSPGYVTTSTDGTNWQIRNPGSSVGLNNVVFGGGNFVCVGASGTILTSPTGAAWTGRYSGSSVSLNGVAYVGGQYIVVGDSGAMLSSPDSVAWTGQASTVTMNLMQVAYGNGIFVVVGQSGTVVMSSDGTNWSQETSGVTADIDSVIFYNSQFVAPVMTGSPSEILTSYDGVHWNVQNFGTPFPFQTVCPLPSGLLFASTNFAMIKTQSLATPELVPSGMTDQGFAVKFFGVPGQSYFLQSSPDLLNSVSSG
jgi:hypothetical protein